MGQDKEKVPMERILYEPGEDSPRFTLLVFTKDTHKLVRRYGGDPVSPLYEPQARRLRAEQLAAGFHTQLIQHRQDGGRMIDSDF